MKIPAAKAAVDKEWEKLENIPAWNLTKVRSKKEVIDEARTSGARVHFASLMDICHLKNEELEAKRSSCTPRWYCKRRFWVLCSIHWTRVISITNDSGKSHGYHIQTAGLRRTSSGRSICFSQVKMEDAPKILKIPKSECPDIWIRLPRHIWPKSWSSMEDPVVPLERHVYGYPLKHGWENFPNWECLFVHSEKRVVLICVCGWHQIGWKEMTHWSDVERTQ